MTRSAIFRSRRMLAVAILTTSTIAASAAQGLGAFGSAQPPAEEGGFSQAQAERGERSFTLSCAACHTVAEMSGGQFRSKWQGQNAADLFGFISSSMPEGDAGSLTPDQYVDIVAYFLSRAGFQAGERDLPADKEVLAKIPIAEAPK